MQHIAQILHLTWVNALNLMAAGLEPQLNLQLIGSRSSSLGFEVIFIGWLICCDLSFSLNNSIGI